MQDTLTVRFLHPSKPDTLTLELPWTTLFSDLTPLLYEKGFLEPQKGGYRFLLQGHLCGTTHPLGDYAAASQMELQVFSYALIMV